MLTLVFYILFLIFLYYGTKTVIKNAIASKGLFSPDFNELNHVWTIPWKPWEKAGRVKLCLFYYLLYLPCVLLLFILDAILVYMALCLAYHLITR